MSAHVAVPDGLGEAVTSSAAILLSSINREDGDKCWSSKNNLFVKALQQHLRTAMMKWCPVTWTTIFGVLCVLMVTCTSSASLSSLSSSSASGPSRQLQGHLPSSAASKAGQFFKMARSPMSQWAYWVPRKDGTGELSLSDFEDPDLMDFHDTAKRQYDDYGHMRYGKRALEDYDYGHMRFGRSLLPASSGVDQKRAQ